MSLAARALLARRLLVHPQLLARAAGLQEAPLEASSVAPLAAAASAWSTASCRSCGLPRAAAARGTSTLPQQPQQQQPTQQQPAAPPKSSRRGKRTRAWQFADGMARPLGADIVSAGAVVLRQEAEEVPEAMLGTPELKELVQTMLDTMRAAPGVGLAAPQIGVPLQVIVLEDREEYIAALPEGVAEQQARAPFEPLVIVNPRLRALSDEGARWQEGCLSVPGYAALVERYACVEVEGLTPEGEPLVLQALGWQARILQHECDHLKGVLYVDRMISRSFSVRGGGGRLPDDVPQPGVCTCCHPIDGPVHVRL